MSIYQLHPVYLHYLKASIVNSAVFSFSPLLKGLLKDEEGVIICTKNTHFTPPRLTFFGILTLFHFETSNTG